MRSQSMCRGYYSLLQLQLLNTLFCTYGLLLTVWELKHESMCVFSSMISLSLLSGTSREQTGPETFQILILCVCVSIHAGVWLHEMR